MMLLQQIEEAIWELEAHAYESRRKDVIICFSQSIKPYVLDKLRRESWMVSPSFANTANLTYINGCEINEFWPYNEIVIYNKILASLNPKFIVKIPFEITKKEG